MPKKHLITTALPYVNGPIHIGHLAGVYVPADIYVRYLRMKKEDVVFIGGSDEHGIPITLRAKKENTTPQEIVNRFHKSIKKSFEDFGISFDNYSRTSLDLHHETAKEFFTKLYEKGVFLEEKSEQFFDVEANEFLADRYITGTCPNCAREDAYGDQCEGCGSSLSPRELIGPKSALSGASPILKETKHWYLPLDKYEDWLRKWALEGHKEWKNNVYGQVKSWLDAGLRPRAITRDLDWGVPVPLKEANGKVLYVWFDAPIGYISSTKEWANKNDRNWEDYWKNPECELIHFIGKDNIVFHSIIFPVMLKEYGEFILPKNVPANEFMNLEDKKISTSRNWAVWLHEYLQDFPGKQDVLRYVLTSNMPETKDNNFTWSDLQIKNNSELVGIFGNFVNRVIVLTHKYYNGIVPTPSEMLDVDNKMLESILLQKQKISENLDVFRFRDALSALVDLARDGNKYLAEQEPWKVVKTDEERVKTNIYVALQVVAALANLSKPFLPHTSTKLNAMLMFEDLSWSDIQTELLGVNHQIGKSELLFAKIEDEEIQIQLDKLNQSNQKNKESEAEKTPQKEECSFDDFLKLDMRLGKVLSAERVPKTDKLLKLLVDIGTEKRTIVSGIAESYSPEDVVNKQVMVLINLKPRKIKGIESQGMLLLSDKEGGGLSLMQPDEENLTPGSIIG